MALSVGVTCDIETQLLIDKHPDVRKPGIWAPYEKETYNAIRELVEKEGVKIVEQKV
jgi:hypothetical protein